MELSEAAALADVFVFRLMFRLYRLPRSPSDYPERRPGPPTGSQAFYEKKRLLAAFAARKYPVRVRHGGRTVEHTHYLTISALAVDTRPGACSARSSKLCMIHERRPLACRSVPFHYSRADSAAAAALDAFVAMPGHECDTSDEAPVVLEGSSVVDGAMRDARAEALSTAERDRPWKYAITRRLARGSTSDFQLPSLAEIEANAQAGALTTPMRAAWIVAVEAGLMSAEDCRSLVTAQLATIGRELADSGCTLNARETLAQMGAEYRRHLAASSRSPAGNG